MKTDIALFNNLPKNLIGLECLLPMDDSFNLKTDILQKEQIENCSHQNENKFSKLRNFSDELKYIMNKSHNMEKPA